MAPAGEGSSRLREKYRGLKGALGSAGIEARESAAICIQSNTKSK
jgi:hypothetical protein